MWEIGVGVEGGWRSEPGLGRVIALEIITVKVIRLRCKLGGI